MPPENPEGTSGAVVAAAWHFRVRVKRKTTIYPNGVTSVDKRYILLMESGSAPGWDPTVELTLRQEDPFDKFPVDEENFIVMIARESDVHRK